jgi:hypothetical protein
MTLTKRKEFMRAAALTDILCYPTDTLSEGKERNIYTNTQKALLQASNVIESSNLVNVRFLLYVMTLSQL